MEKHSGDRPEKDQLAAHEQTMDIDHELIINLRDVNHIMRFLYEGRASQKRILIILSEVKSITQRELTMRLGIQPGSASEILSKLENAGLILRTASEADRRTVDLSLTARGEQMAREAAGQRTRRHKEMFSCLSESEKEGLLMLLGKLNEDWSRRYGMAEKRNVKRHLQEQRHRGGRGHGYGQRCGETEDKITWENT